jgi:hypothetical protein
MIKYTKVTVVKLDDETDELALKEAEYKGIKKGQLLRMIITEYYRNKQKQNESRKGQ